MTLRWQDYIEERGDVMLGKPVFKGTRLTVEHILKELGAEMSHPELLENYPSLKPEHIQAAMLFAAYILGKNRSVFSLRVKRTKTRSPFDVPGVKTAASTSDILDAVRESRER